MSGAGIGASYQTGWTGLVVKLIQQYHQQRDGYQLSAFSSGIFAGR